MFSTIGQKKRLVFMDRGLVGKARGFPIEGQRKVHEQRKTQVVYDDADDAIAHLREGDRLTLAGPLHILGASRVTIRDRVQQVKGKGCEVLDLVHNESTEGTGFEAFGRAYDLTNPAHNFKGASAAGKKGAAARIKKHKPKGVTIAEARRIWFDPMISTNGEALAKMGWSLSRANAKFGGSGRPAGPRRKQED